MSAFVRQSEIRNEDFGWGVIGWRCTPGGTGAKQLVVLDVSLERGQSHNFHRHPGQEEMIIVKSGEVEQWLEQEAATLRPGDSVFIGADLVARHVQRRGRDGAPAGRSRSGARQRDRLRARRRLRRGAVVVASLRRLRSAPRRAPSGATARSTSTASRLLPGNERPRGDHGDGDSVMSAWTSDALDRIGADDELQLTVSGRTVMTSP